MKHGPPHSSGVTLIELMVALAIGTILMLGLVQVFAASRAAYSTAEGMSRVQENARFALHFLQREIRMAGHFGCINDQAHWVRDEGDPVHPFSGFSSGSGHPLDFSVSVEGYEAPDTGPSDELMIGDTWAAPTGLPTLTPVPVGGSDVLVLRYFAPAGVPVDGITIAGGIDRIAFDAENADRLTRDGVSTPTLFGVADCTHADVFPGTLSGGQVSPTLPTNLSSRYAPRPGSYTKLYRANVTAFYVAENGFGEPALFRARADRSGVFAPAEELVDGIESLQILYGQDSQTALGPKSPPIGNITHHGTAAHLRAVPAADLPNAWRRVGLVQIGILARSPPSAAAASAGEPITVLGTQFQPPSGGTDGRMRASYESTIALRNRLFGN